jgi:hypothetical protein
VGALKGPDEITTIRRTTLRLFGMVVSSSLQCRPFNVTFCLRILFKAPARDRHYRRQTAFHARPSRQYRTRSGY